MKQAIKIRETVVFDGYTGWEDQGTTYRLACGAWLCQTDEGLLCCWLTGSDNEPATDNCTVFSRSTDDGKTWSVPTMLVPPGKENGSAWLLSRPGRLIALCARWPMEDLYTVWHYSRMESPDGGRTWNRPVPFRLIEGNGISASFGQLIRTGQGEHLFCASTFRKRRSPLTAGAERLAFAVSEEEAAAMEPRRPGERDAFKFATHLHGCAVFETDADITSCTMRGEVNNRPLGLLEPTMVELRDGRLAMLMRAEWGGFLWRSDSADGGRTWTPAYQTDIPNPTSMAHVLRIPDGRIVLFHNDCGSVVGKKPAMREPLSVWVSDDDMESWYIKQNILTGGNLAYPNGLILRDGRIVMAYDHNRRRICFVELDIDRI